MADPISVTLVGDSLFRKLTWAARFGSLYDPTTPLQFSTIDIKDLFRPPFNIAKQGSCFTVIILNSLPKALKKTNEYLYSGQQLGHPALTDFGKHLSKPDEIPAARPDPLNPANTLAGVGLYVYDHMDDLTLTCKGALALSTGDKDSNIAIRWQTNWGWINPTVAISANYPDEYKDLQDFYTNVPDSQGPLVSTSTQSKAFASMIWYHDGGDGFLDKGHILVWVTDPSTA